MAKFKGKTQDGKPLSAWKAIYRECIKHPQFIIEVREYNSEAEISDAQRKWLHCKDGPIHILADTGMTLAEAKLELKRKCGRQWFVQPVTEKNFDKVEGTLYYECQKSFCNKLFHPVQVRLSGKAQCPFCGSESIQLVNIKSIMNVSVKNVNQWFTEIYNFMDSINHPVRMPDPEWRTNNE